MPENFEILMQNLKKDFQNLKKDLSELGGLVATHSNGLEEILECIFYCFSAFQQTYLLLRNNVFNSFLVLHSKDVKPIMEHYSVVYGTKNFQIQQLKKDILRIQMPPLLHKKVFQKLRKDDTYVENYYTHEIIFEDLKALLIQFKKEKCIDLYQEKCVLFVLNISTKKVLTDTDNHEYQQLINTISHTFCYDDSPNFLSLYVDTFCGPEDKTILYLCPIRKAKELFMLLEKENFNIKEELK